MSFGPFESQKDLRGKTCMVTFRIFLPASIAPEPRSIYVYGSWNGYRIPSRLERDSRSGPGIWKEQIPASGLIQGQSYGYYYLLDNRTPWYDPSAKRCVDIDINETVMILEVPMLLPDGVPSPAASSHAVSPPNQCHNPNTVSSTSDQRTRLQVPTSAVPSRSSSHASVQQRRLAAKNKADSPTVRFDPSVSNPQSNFRSLPARNVKKRRSLVGLLSMGSGSGAAASTESLHKTISLKKSWMSIFKSKRHVSHSDIKVTVTRPPLPVRRHTEQPLQGAATTTEKPIGLGIVIPDSSKRLSSVIQPSTSGTRHLRRPSIPDEWRASVVAAQQADAKENSQGPPKLTIRTVPNTPSVSSRGTRKRSNAVVERRSNSFDEVETPLDSAKFLGPSSSISSLSSYGASTPRHSIEAKGSSRKVFISPQDYTSGKVSPALSGRCYLPAMNGLKEEAKGRRADPRRIAHEMGWHNDVVIA